MNTVFGAGTTKVDTAVSGFTSPAVGDGFILDASPLPVGGADSFSTPTNTTVAIAAAKFKLNDTGDGVSLTAVQTPSTQGGTLSLSGADSTVTYTPPSASFGGTDTFTYTIVGMVFYHWCSI